MLSVESLLGWCPSPSEAAEAHLSSDAQSVARRLIADTLPRLEETRRLVMALIYYEELTEEEIAQALALSAADVKRIHAETVALLRDEIASRLGEQAELPGRGSR